MDKDSNTIDQRLLQLKNAISKANFYNQRPSDNIINEYTMLMKYKHQNKLPTGNYQLTTDKWNQQGLSAPTVVPSFTE